MFFIASHRTLCFSYMTFARNAHHNVSEVEIYKNIGVTRIFSGVHYFPKKLLTFLVVTLNTQAR